MESSVEQIILGRYMEMQIANMDIVMDALLMLIDEIESKTPLQKEQIEVISTDIKKARQSGKNFIGNDKFIAYKAGLFVE